MHHIKQSLLQLKCKIRKRNVEQIAKTSQHFPTHGSWEFRNWIEEVLFSNSIGIVYKAAIVVYWIWISIWYLAGLLLMLLAEIAITWFIQVR